MLNFRLKVFQVVARHLSFRKAGEELYLSQPAVSSQIKALAEEVGLQFFDSGRQYVGAVRSPPSDPSLGQAMRTWRSRWERCSC